VNVAFSWCGLQKLGVSPDEDFCHEFKHCPQARAQVLGDHHEKSWINNEWKVGGSDDTEPHALLILATDMPDESECLLSEHCEKLKSLGVTWMVSYRGRASQNGREHFGFKDGISRPDPKDPLAGWVQSKTDQIIAPGEFILGAERQQGGTSFGGPDWASNGSYLVFRRLKQNVDVFHHEVMEATSSLAEQGMHLNACQVASKFLGRWPSGSKPSLPIEFMDPGLSPESTRISPCEYARDLTGERFPLFAHIRKANPRSEDHESDLRSLIRRGIPYEQGDQDRGLLFVAYQANIAQQFMHIQKEWLDKASFPEAHSGEDPIAGGVARNEDRKLTVVHEGKSLEVTVKRFVETTGSCYMFCPSIGALESRLSDVGKNNRNPLTLRIWKWLTKKRLLT
jgi:Dyp-type peroxidase family